MNVILICLDTFRADCIAAAGRNDFIKTPNLDRLVNEGVLFDNAFGEGQPTIQFRRALVTGNRTFPFDGAYDTIGCWPTNPGWHKIPPEMPTLAEVLLQNGYATGLVADTYHMFKPTMNYTRGMASWEFVRGQETDNYRSGPLSAIDLTKYSKEGVTEKGEMSLIAQYLLNRQDWKTEDDYLPAQTFTAANRFLEDNADNQPFFLWIDSFDPHEPFDPPTEYADMYDPDWDEDWEPIHGVPDDCDEKVRRRVRALYHGSCTFVDKQIGRLLDKLDELRLANDTMIVVTSDHGTELWDHGANLKGVNKCRYRCNNEILCLMKWPDGSFAGKRVEGFVQNQDLFPTILNILGVEGPTVDGVDLMPLVSGDAPAIREHVITGWSGGKSSMPANVRTHEWSYSVDYLGPDLKEWLFDLTNDPSETTNVVEANPEVVADLRNKLETFLNEKLPAKPRHETHYYKTPVKVWWEKAQWAKRLRGE